MQGSPGTATLQTHDDFKEDDALFWMKPPDCVYSRPPADGVLLIVKASKPENNIILTEVRF